MSMSIYQSINYISSRTRDPWNFDWDPDLKSYQIEMDPDGFANRKFCKYTSEDDNFNLIWNHYCVLFVNMTQVISRYQDIKKFFLKFVSDVYFNWEYLKVTERPQTSFDLFFNCICSHRPLPPHLGKHIHGDIREHYVNKVLFTFTNIFTKTGLIALRLSNRSLYKRSNQKMFN